MEIAEVRKRMLATIERAKREAAERRTRVDAAARAYETFLDRIAVPLFKQVGNVLRAEGFSFTVFTPGGSVRLMSDRGADDYIELTLDSSGEPLVIGHTSRARGRRVVETEQALGAPEALTEDDVLAFILQTIGPLVQR